MTKDQANTIIARLSFIAGGQVVIGFILGVIAGLLS